MLGREGAVMTTLDDVAKKKQAAEQSAEQLAAVELVRAMIRTCGWFSAR
jgi:hypothetical protein